MRKETTNPHSCASAVGGLLSDTRATNGKKPSHHSASHEDSLLFQLQTSTAGTLIYSFRADVFGLKFAADEFRKMKFKKKIFISYLIINPE